MQIESGTCKRMAMVARTAADVRDVLIEGESGLLSVSRPSFYPKYQPSMRRVVWPNGAQATTYSADEPDLLRGPQHDGALCLVGETRVLMHDLSEKPIKDISVGDVVMTRNGSRAVTNYALTKRQSDKLVQLQCLDGRVIIGTANHPVWVGGQGFIPLGSITEGMKVCVTNALNGVGTYGIAPSAVTIHGRSGFIGRFGNPFTGLFRRVITSIIRTKINLITILIILNYLPIRNIAGYTFDTCWRLIASRLSSILKRLTPDFALSECSAFLSACNAGGNTIAGPKLPEDFVLQNVLSAFVGGALLANLVDVNTAESLIRLYEERNGIAPSGATIFRQKSGQVQEQCEPFLALIVRRHLTVNEATPAFVGDHAPSLSMMPIVSVEKLSWREDVYNIAVEGEHEFFANGILTHNCDELASWRYLTETWDNLLLGLRLGTHPQAVVMTTPRPIKQLKTLLADPTTAVTRGSTYENLENLAPPFRKQIVEKYEGTRLGRQEIGGEMLEDMEGALWTRAMIEKARRKAGQIPEMVRIVVAIDPAVTSTEESDETGICVAGKGADGRGYILADRSGRFTPDGWATRAVVAFDEFKADKIIAETNNGGDLVERTIRTVRHSISYKKVHASRGKYVRAEPVAALYEQGRISHIGMFPEMEDQMCSFVPEGMDQSPDRAEAAIWALTELFLEGKRAFAA
jgi:phage terminase large subunit-like protein